MAMLTPLELAQVQTLGRRFGLDFVDVEPLAAGSVNSNFRLSASDGTSYFARIYEEQAVSGARAEARLLRELLAAGVPTAVPLTQSGGEDSVVEVMGKPFSVYPWIQGEDLCYGLVTSERCEALGEALATVHLATERLSAIPEGRFDWNSLLERLTQAEQSAPRLRADVEYVRAKLREYREWSDSELPSGLIHGDLFRDNVLWEQQQIVALLDFESASRGVWVYDLMVCVLSWCYTSSMQWENARGIVRGYQRLRRLTEAEKANAVAQAALVCLRFATTRMTDFELRAGPGEAAKRDYRRFLQRLETVEKCGLDALWTEQQEWSER